MKKFDTIALSELEKRTSSLRKNKSHMQVRQGWIQYVRLVLGMTQKNLAAILKISPATVNLLEKRELKGKVMIETLQKVADALECDLVYAFVPRKNIKVVLKEKARKKAEALLRKADIHMTLEDQKVKKRFQDRVDQLAKDLLEKGDVW